MEEDYEPAVQHQRRVNPKIHDVIKKEVEKLLDAGLTNANSIVLDLTEQKKDNGINVESAQESHPSGLQMGMEVSLAKDSLWTKVIVAIHGVGGKIHSEWTSTGKSCWLSILSEVRSLQRKGVTMGIGIVESTYIFVGLHARRRIDEICLPNIGEETRWVKCVPIKINVLAWKIKTDALPTRFNISRRGIDIQDSRVPL
ncbi:hypothetical protein Tco_1507469 [Tanacetum coccineum]